MLSRLFPQREERTQVTPWGDWNDTPTTWSGLRVDPSTAMQLLTVYGCVRLISDQVSTLPVDVFRSSGDARTEVTPPTWLTQPTVDLDFPAWCGQVLHSLLLQGNAYVAVLRSETRGIVELPVLDPAKVTVTRMAGRKTFLVNGTVYPGEIRHVAGLMRPGSDVGLSPLEAARQSIGLGLAALEFGSNSFEREGNMPGVIEIPGKAQPDQMKAMADLWRRKRTRANRGLPGVLESGATWKPTGVTNEQAQFLATRKYTAAEIAGQMFLVDPTDLGIPVEGTSITYGNLEQRNQRRVQVTLLPWIIRVEKLLSDLLAAPRFVKLNVNGLLRGDLPTRYDAYATGLDHGFLDVAEVRAWEDLPPRPDAAPSPGGDT